MGETGKLVLSIIQVIICILVVVLTLLQSGKRAGLSGAISGGAETFFGKNKARAMDAKLEKATIVGGIALVVITLIINFMF